MCVQTIKKFSEKVDRYTKALLPYYHCSQLGEVIPERYTVTLNIYGKEVEQVFYHARQDEDTQKIFADILESWIDGCIEFNLEDNIKCLL